MNDELKQLCLEIYQTERNKLEGMIHVYCSGLDLIRAVELANPPVPQADEIITKLKTYLEPFEDICSLVGPSVPLYLSEELGIDTMSTDSAEDIAHNLLKLIANDYFISIRKAAASAGSQFAELSQLYQKVSAMLKWPSIAFNNFQADQIKCVQIFSQFALLGDKLKEDVSILYASDHKLYNVSVLFAELCSLAVSYANFTQKRSDKSLAYVAPDLVPFLEVKRTQCEQQLKELVAERLKFEQKLLVLNPTRELCTLLIQATDTAEQEQLFQRWKAEYTESILVGNKYPKTPKEIAELTQELSYFELGFQQITCALEQVIAQEQSLIVQLKQIQDALLKLDFSGRIDRLQAVIINKAEQYGITPVATTRKSLPVSTFVPISNEETVIPSKSSSSRLFKRLRAATSSTPKLVRTHSEPSPSCSEGVIDSTGSPRDIAETKSEMFSSFKSASSDDAQSLASSSNSGPISSKKSSEHSIKSPRLFSHEISAPVAVNASASPTIRQRIDSLNALGGINLAMVRK